MSNRWVKLTVVPQLAGRVMQVSFGGHEYLFVNNELKGRYYPPEVSEKERKWFNYGGDKIWPMPEGNDDEQHWAGAAGAVLDSGPFSFSVLSPGDGCAVRLVGPPDPQIGEQYIREISIGSNSPEIFFKSIMKNTTGYPLRWSEQTVSQYNAADPANPTDYNHDFWGFTSANSDSQYLNSYYVRTGSGANRSYQVRDGLFTLHWSNIGGEVWIDSPGGWVAIVDGRTGYTMVERFHYKPGAEYPGKATVIFFTTGQRNPPSEASPPHPIHYMEAEINSPVVELAPGESYSMETEWFPTRMGSDFKACTYAGVVGAPVTASVTAGGLLLAGKFGVFFPGRLVARLYDRGGMSLGTVLLAAVNPLEPIALNSTLQAPAETARVSVHLVDSAGLDRGPLGETQVVPPPPHSPDTSQWGGK